MDERTKQLVALGIQHFDQREFNKATRYLKEAVDLGEPFPDVLNTLGMAHYHAGRIEAGRDCFWRALRLNPAYTEAALNLSIACNELGEYDEAIVAFKHAAKNETEEGMAQPKFIRGRIANMHVDLAQAYMDAGMAHEAIVEFKKALALCPEFADVHVKLADIYRLRGRFGTARELLERVLDDQPKYSPARVLLGVIMLAQGHYDEAVANWRRVLQEEPSYTTARLYLRLAGEHKEPVESTWMPAARAS